MNSIFNAIITEEGNGFVVLNPDTGVTTQGNTLDEALANLKEAMELYFEEVGEAKKATLSLHRQSFLTTITL